MERYISMNIHITFPLKSDETQEQAEDRLMEALDTGVPGYVMSWSGEKIEEYEDDDDGSD